MKGTILHFNVSNNTGVIRGNDGKRYQFTNSDWKDEKEFPRIGLFVNFEVNLNNEPVDIYCIPKDKRKLIEDQENKRKLIEDQGIWQYDGCLVILREASLPNRCIKTNRPTMEKVELTLSWFYTSSLFNIIILLVLVFFVPLIVAIPIIIAIFAMTKREKITFGLCQEVKKQQRLLTDVIVLIVLGVTLILLTPAIIIPNMNQGFVSAIGVLAIPALLCLPFWLILRASPLSFVSGVSIVWIKGEYICISGINKEYLSEFPEWSNDRLEKFKLENLF